MIFEFDLAEGIDLAMYLLGSFERDTYRALSRLTRPGATVVDIGANFGVHALPLARIVGPEGRVIAFEPTGTAFNRLVRNLKLNPEIAGRVRPVLAYLTDGRNEAPAPAFYSSWRLDSVEHRHPKHLGSIASADRARAWTLDDYVAHAQIGTIDVMKIDVDGYECRVLRGAKATMMRDHPAIVIEVCPYALEEHGDSAKDLLQILAEQGYAFLDESLRPLPSDARAVEATIKPNSLINIVALARGAAAR